MDDIKVIKIEPYDVLLLTYGPTMDADFIEDQRKSWQKLFPNCVIIANRNDVLHNIVILKNPNEVKK